MPMTPDEKMLWDYIDVESNELLMKIRDDVAQDGFDVLLSHEQSATELLALKVISATMIKTLAMVCEAKGKTDLMQAYMEMAPMHADLLKAYMMKESGL
jgi:hypothetical protein